MRSFFVALSGALAVIVHSSQAIAQNPNDPVYENKPLSQWVRELSDNNPNRRWKAAYAMRDLGPKAKVAVPILHKMLKEDSSERAREWAGYALAAVAPEDPEVPRALVLAMQKEASETVRTSISGALSGMKPKPTAVIPELEQLLSHDSAQVRRNAVEALWAIEEPKKLTPILLSLLGDKDASVRETIGVHLAFQSEPDITALRRALHNDSPTIKAGASIALGHIARFPSQGETSLIKELLPSILGLLKDKEGVVRESAAKTLYLFGSGRQRRSFMGQCDIASGIPALIAAIKDQDSTVRGWSILALGEIGPEAQAAVPALTEALLDKSIRVRQVAAAALGRIGPKAKSAVPALILALKDPDVSVRSAAASGLAGIGPDAKAALPALREASESEHIEIQRQAANAVRNIDVVIDIQKDSKNFDAIIRYWQQQFPKSTFEGAFVHLTNGPGGNWLHIHVPPDIEALYQHPYSRDFLEEHLKDKENLPRAIATDLLSLKQPIKGKGGGGTISYDLGRPIPVVDYTVIQTWQMICRER
jgi:HEAT repeat protein